MCLCGVFLLCIVLCVQAAVDPDKYKIKDVVCSTEAKRYLELVQRLEHTSYHVQLAFNENTNVLTAICEESFSQTTADHATLACHQGKSKGDSVVRFILGLDGFCAKEETSTILLLRGEHRTRLVLSSSQFNATALQDSALHAARENADMFMVNDEHAFVFAEAGVLYVNLHSLAESPGSEQSFTATDYVFAVRSSNTAVACDSEKNECQEYTEATGWSKAQYKLKNIRNYHTLTGFEDGELIAVGGDKRGVASAEELKKKENNFASIASPPDNRFHHAAVKLNEGNLLVCGGCSDVECREVLSTCYVYSRRNDKWSWVQE